MSAAGTDGAADAVREMAQQLLTAAEAEVRRLTKQGAMYTRLGFKATSQVVLANDAALRTAREQVAYAMELLADAKKAAG